MKKEITGIIVGLIFEESSIYDIKRSIFVSQYDGPDTFEIDAEVNHQKLIVKCFEDKDNISISVIIEGNIIASKKYEIDEYNKEYNKRKISEELETVLRWTLLDSSLRVKEENNG